MPLVAACVNHAYRVIISYANAIAIGSPWFLANVYQDDPVKAVAYATGGAMAGLMMDVSGHPNGVRLSLDWAGIGANVIMPGLMQVKYIETGLVNNIGSVGLYGNVTILEC